MSKHSPGPWGIGGSLVSGPDGHSPIAVVLHKSSGKARDEDYFAPPFETYEANGALIAAAPELLDGMRYLQSVLASIRDNEEIPAHPVHGKIRTYEEVKYLIVDPLIEKATGEPQ